MESNIADTTFPAWRGLGVDLRGSTSIEAAVARASDNKTFLKLDLEATITGQDGTVSRMPLTNSKVIVDSNGKEFNTVGADFELFQPSEMGNRYREFYEKNLITLIAGGMLRGGSQFFMLGKVNGANCDILANDTVESYLLMFTGFDGSLSTGHTFTVNRATCKNVLAVMKWANMRHIKHTKNMRVKVATVDMVLKNAMSQFEQTTEAYKTLAHKNMTEKEQIAYIKSVFLTPQEIAKPEEVSTRKSNTVRYVIDLLDTQKGIDLIPAMRGTSWQAYNAVTQYLTHDQGNNVDTRLQSQWFGQGAAMNAKALELALTM